MERSAGPATKWVLGDTHAQLASARKERKLCGPRGCLVARTLHGTCSHGLSTARRQDACPVQVPNREHNACCTLSPTAAATSAVRGVTATRAPVSLSQASVSQTQTHSWQLSAHAVSDSFSLCIQWRRPALPLRGGPYGSSWAQRIAGIATPALWGVYSGNARLRQHKHCDTTTVPVTT